MFFRKRSAEAESFPALQQALRHDLLAAITKDLEAFGYSAAADVSLDLPMIRSPEDTAKAVAKIATAILKVLEKDPKLRELYGDLVQKLHYLGVVAPALVKLTETIARLPKSDAKTWLDNVSKLIREFLAFEACFDAHKSLEAWNRLKGAAAGKLDARQYAWLNAFYMHFGAFAALAGSVAKEAAEILEALARILANGLGDRAAVLEALKLGVAAVRCIQRLAMALADFLEQLGDKAAADRLTR
jgi:hypothetical protein